VYLLEFHILAAETMQSMPGRDAVKGGSKFTDIPQKITAPILNVEEVLNKQHAK
jgi:hypothetical protein